SFAWCTGGIALGELGTVVEARELEERAIAFFPDKGNLRWKGYARTYLARILLLSGFIEEAEAEARRAVELLEPMKIVKVRALATLASVLLARGRPAEALAPASEAMALLEELGKVEEGEALARAVQAEALWATGEHEAA